MGRIHADLPYVDFEIPSTVKQATICTSSGLLAGSGCPTRTEYFETSTIPTVRCTPPLCGSYTTSIALTGSKSFRL